MEPSGTSGGSQAIGRSEAIMERLGRHKTQEVGIPRTLFLTATRNLLQKQKPPARSKAKDFDN